MILSFYVLSGNATVESLLLTRYQFLITQKV